VILQVLYENLARGDGRASADGNDKARDSIKFLGPFTASLARYAKGERTAFKLNGGSRDRLRRDSFLQTEISNMGVMEKHRS
jgi:hypothetical protein